MRASPDRIVVCAGFAHGLQLLGQVLAARGGTRVAMEAYGLAAHRDTVAAAGLAVTPVPVDEQVTVTGIAAGLHALAELPAGQDEAEVVARAAGHGLLVEGLRPYSAAGRTDRAALVVGYAAPAQHAFTGALARLTAVLAAR